MTHIRALLWGLAVMAIALLNIVGILPDWTTIAAILAVPIFVSGNACCLPRRNAQ